MLLLFQRYALLPFLGLNCVVCFYVYMGSGFEKKGGEKKHTHTHREEEWGLIPGSGQHAQWTRSCERAEMFLFEGQVHNDIKCETNSNACSPAMPLPSHPH
jgi:hypothetical protein